MMFPVKILAALLLVNQVSCQTPPVYGADCWADTDCKDQLNRDNGCILAEPPAPPLPDCPDYGFMGPFSDECPAYLYMGENDGKFCANRKSFVDYDEAYCFCHEIGAKSWSIWAPDSPECFNNPRGWGDPHFLTFGGEHYDFHGVCDLVMFDAPKMNTTIHVRTSSRYRYSYISSAAIRVNGQVLEVESFGDYIFEGVSQADLPDKVGGYKFEKKRINRKTVSFKIHFSDTESIELKTYKDLVAVNFNLAHNGGFASSLGLLGSPSHHGKKIGRDGETEIEDANEFGAEWQVLSSEPKLFQDANRVPQHPATCIMPSTDDTSEVGRRLGETIAREAAEKACAKWHLNKESCIFDVMITGDLDLADANAF